MSDRKRKTPGRKKGQKSAKQKKPTQGTNLEPVNDGDDQIDESTVEFLESLPEEMRGQVIASMVMSKSHSGPLPSAEELQKYEGVQQGLAERIVIMAETEQSHRHQFDNKAVASYDRRGTYSLILGLVLIGTAVYALFLGLPIAAIPLGVIGVIGTIVNTIYKHLSQDK